MNEKIDISTHSTFFWLPFPSNFLDILIDMFASSTMASVALLMLLPLVSGDIIMCDSPLFVRDENNPEDKLNFLPCKSEQIYPLKY